MTEQDLYDAIGRVGGDLIEKSSPDVSVCLRKPTKSRRFLAIAIAAAAASAIAAVLIPLIVWMNKAPEAEKTQPVQTDAAGSETEMKTITTEVDAAQPSGESRTAENRSGSGILIEKTEGQDSSITGKEGLPWARWQRAFAYRLQTEKSVYLLQEQPVLELEYGLVRDDLQSGTVKINVDAGDFSITASEFSTDEFTYPENSMQTPCALSIPLTASENDCFGQLAIVFLFYPDDPESCGYAKYLSNGALFLGRLYLSYVVNRFEIVFSTTNPWDFYEIELAELYRSGRISAKEFADSYYEFILSDLICSSIDVEDVDGSFRFFYRSKNIRYDSPFIDDRGIADANKAKDARLVAMLALEYMRLNGIITQDEYDDELKWCEQVGEFGLYDIGFDMNVSTYREVLQRNMYTH